MVPHDALEGVEVLMDKDARSIGIPLTTLSPEVKRQLAKWGIQQEKQDDLSETNVCSSERIHRKMCYFCKIIY